MSREDDLSFYKKLKVLHINTADIGGGAESSAWNLFQSLRKKGYESWLAVGEKFSDDPNVYKIPNTNNRDPFARFLVNVSSTGKGSKFEFFSNFLVKLSYIGEMRRFRDKLKGIEDFHFPGTKYILTLPPKSPTIVHCHNLHGNYFDLRLLPWLSHQVPLILNLRDCWLLSGHCAHSMECENWRDGCGNCPDLDIYPSIRMDSTSLNWIRKKQIYDNSRLYIVAPSQWLIDKVNESMLIGCKYKVIPNSIDTTIFKPEDKTLARAALGLPLNAKIILLIAHNMFKDITTMEKAIEYVNFNYCNEKLLFLCLGRSGKDRLLGPGEINYIGFIQNQKIMKYYYQASDVYIHAAHDEVFGKTITEAMACGLPVVATDVGGIKEQIIDGKTGFLIPKGDATVMAARVDFLLKNEEIRYCMGKRAAENARLRFNLDQQVTEYLDWYSEVIVDWKLKISQKVT